MSTPARTAIIGMACVFPQAPTLAQFWRNIEQGVDAITEVPAARWDAAFYDPHSRAADRFYCRRGGFIDADAGFDPLAFGVMPKAVASAEPDQLLALRIGHEALRDAGYATRAFARERCGVVIGRGNYPGAGVLRLGQRVRLVPQVLQTLHDLWPDLPASTAETVRQRLEEQLIDYGPDVAGELIPNLLASRLAHRLGLHGPAYTVDAACASSLIAVEQACHALARHDSDLMIVGGVHLSHDLTFWATFCQLGALSRAQASRPLAAQADGILAGEGIGMAVLKRLDDARADGDRIYAVIEGAGSASDGGASSLLAPAVAGQRLALERAWAGLPFGRRTIGLLEAHGTGTPAGDAAELQTVKDFFGAPTDHAPRPVVGAVKSMIGHTMPASGMAGLIKSALAIHHGVLPPTLHCEQPHALLAETAFRVIDRAEPWTAPAHQRVAAVNAFGFGGINAHLVLRGVADASPLARPTVPALMLSAASPAALLARLDRGEHDAPGSTRGPCRLVVIEPDARKLALARAAVQAGEPWRGRQQIWFAPHGLLSAGGKLAFLFPGVDHRFAPRAEDLAASFGPVPAAVSVAADAPLTQRVMGLLGFNRYMLGAVRRLGLQADGMAGHSVGEWSAMLAAGLLDQGFSERTNAALDLRAMHFPDVQFLAAHCSAARLQQALAGVDGAVLSHDNCAHQAMACGDAAALDRLAQRLRDGGIVAHRMPFASGMHSPFFTAHLPWYAAFFEAATLAAPSVPVWSATSAAPFPAAASAIRRLALDHLVQPVRFRELVVAMHDDGFRVFVEVGTGSLCGFVNDTLAQRPHHAIASNVERRSGIAQLRHLCAALWTEGAEVDLSLFDVDASVPAATSQTLALGVPLLRVAPLGSPAPDAATPLPDDPVGREVHAALREIELASREVVALWQQHQQQHQAAPASPRQIDTRLHRRLSLDDASAACVRDHQLYPQRTGWPIIADGHPVVPLTMELALVIDALQTQSPGRVVVEACDVQAYSWLEIATPRDVEIQLRSCDDTTVDAEITGCFRATLTLAAGYPAAPMSADPSLVAPRAPAIDAQALYQQRWMFHGPAYQGVTRLGPIGDNGIDGALCVTAGQGALLDAMGQLAGYWVMEQADNPLAMPLGIDRVRFFGPPPAPGACLHGAVRVAALDALGCTSDIRLRDTAGQLQVAIDGWRTRRYVMDRSFFDRSRDLAHTEVVQWLAPNVAFFDDRYDSANMREHISRRFLTAAERAVYDDLSPRRRRQWLAGRVAAKDAVRAWLRRERGLQAVHPQEVMVINDDVGAPLLRGNVTSVVPPSLRLSISHKNAFAVAMVDEVPVGIDIEHIRSHEPGVLRLAFDVDEMARLVETSDDRDDAFTRGWAAKEVVAKLDGRGLGGRLRELVVQARDGDLLRVAGQTVRTCRVGDHIVAWSVPA